MENALKDVSASGARGPSTLSDRATERSAGPSGDVECIQCGCAFTNAAAFDAHRPDGKCVNPTNCGLVVAPRVKLTWSVPVRVPVDVDMLGNVTRWIDVDREIAGQWDDRCWRDYP